MMHKPVEYMTFDLRTGVHVRRLAFIQPTNTTAEVPRKAFARSNGASGFLTPVIVTFGPGPASVPNPQD